jgi:hypothetical protein
MLSSPSPALRPMPMPEQVEARTPAMTVSEPMPSSGECGPSRTVGIDFGVPLRDLVWCRCPAATLEVFGVGGGQASSAETDCFGDHCGPTCDAEGRP